MATLKNTFTKQRFPLATRTLVGRLTTCHLQLSSAQVSGIHAEIAWNGERWTVRDLGSSNGTTLDGQALAPKERRALLYGAQIQFGAPENSFDVIDASPPQLVITSSDGSMQRAERGLLCLPSEDNPKFTLLESAEGGWLLETEESLAAVVDQQTLVVDGRQWCINLPGEVKATEKLRDVRMSVTLIGLNFQVSRDEEHVAIGVRQGSRVIPLKARAHDFFLLTLARARITDHEQPGLHDSEHGWVYLDDLVQRLQVDRKRLNLWIHRARRQFADAGVLDVARLIERRRGADQIRLGIPQLEIAHG
ncbi:MAG: FHA domain-containing protein [Myxococcota bacterium]